MKRLHSQELDEIEDLRKEGLRGPFDLVEQQILETDDGVRRFGPERPFVVLDKLAMLVDDPGQGVGNDQRVVGFQSIHTETQEVGLNHVIEVLFQQFFR